MMTTSGDALAGGIPDRQAVERLVREFEAGLPRLFRLARYYDGRHDILARARLSGLPNSRLVHAFPRYIAQVSASYLLGEPVRVEGQGKAAERLRELLRHASADSIDLELAISQAVFGRAVSLCYEDARRQPFVCALDPRDAFVVYGDTVAREPLFGVYLSGGPRGGFTVYTPHESLAFPPGGGQPEVAPHAFGALPMVEYQNGRDCHGDFEDVLTLIDAYDLLAALERFRERLDSAEPAKEE